MLSYKTIGGNLIDKSPEKIQKMFDTISDKYDFLNNIMSFGTQIFIKKDCINQLNSKEPLKILDLCCGTGDLTRILRKKFPDAEVFGVDFSEDMLKIALNKDFESEKLKVESGKLSTTLAEKTEALPSPMGKVSEGRKGVGFNFPLSTFNFQLINFIQADATNLPFPDNSFDIVTIGFGLRNIEDFDGTLKEIYRVLKPNGEFLHLDFGEKNILNKIFDKITPNLVRFFTKNNEAYSYLIQSKQEFFKPDELIKKFENKGFKFVKRKDYLLGAISCQIVLKS